MRLFPLLQRGQTASSRRVQLHSGSSARTRDRRSEARRPAVRVPPVPSAQTAAHTCLLCRAPHRLRGVHVVRRHEDGEQAQTTRAPSGAGDCTLPDSFEHWEVCASVAGITRGYSN